MKSRSECNYKLNMDDLGNMKKYLIHNSERNRTVTGICSTSVELYVIQYVWKTLKLLQPYFPVSDLVLVPHTQSNKEYISGSTLLMNNWCFRNDFKLPSLNVIWNQIQHSCLLVSSVISLWENMKKHRAAILGIQQRCAKADSAKSQHYPAQSTSLTM